jgi:2'-5' RNA ligase
MRLFFAINFSDALKSRLLALRDTLRKQSSHGNFSLPDNLHLTLAFLGECDEREMALAKAALDKTAFQPLEVVIDTLGRFKNRGGDLWWAGAKASAQLAAFQAALSTNLADAGFEIEKRPFHGHVTLGREVVTTARPGPIEPFGEEIKSVELMRSERKQGALVYTAVYSQHE